MIGLFDGTSVTRSVRYALKLKKVMVICLVVFTALLIAVTHEVVQNIDQVILLKLSSIRSSQLDMIMIGLTYMGSYTAMWLLTIPVGAYFIISRRIDLVAAHTLILVGSNPLIFLVKEGVQRARPEGIAVYSISGYSFPSGHALASMCFYFGTFYLISLLPQNHARRYSLRIIGFSFALMISFTRLYLGVHYPSDVVAGIALALFWIAVVLLFHYSVQDRIVRFTEDHLMRSGSNISST